MLSSAGLMVHAAPFACSLKSRKTECGVNAFLFWSHGARRTFARSLKSRKTECGVNAFLFSSQGARRTLCASKKRRINSAHSAPAMPSITSTR